VRILFIVALVGLPRLGGVSSGVYIESLVLFVDITIRIKALDSIPTWQLMLYLFKSTDSRLFKCGVAAFWTSI
jgi:hypothetical protein